MEIVQFQFVLFNQKLAFQASSVSFSKKIYNKISDICPTIFPINGMEKGFPIIILGGRSDYVKQQVIIEIDELFHGLFPQYYCKKDCDVQGLMEYISYQLIK